MSATWTPTPPRPAPANTVGFVAWARANLFATKADTLLTLIAVTLIVYLTEAIFGWAIIDASFSGTDRAACLKEVQGACWPFIDAWLRRKFKNTEASVWIGIVAVLVIIGLTVWEASVAH